MKKTYSVIGMSCAACSQRVERAVSGLRGVEECSVNLLTGRMILTGEFSEKEVFSAVASAGYGIASYAAEGVEVPKKMAPEEVRRLRKRLFLSLGFLLALSYLAMGHMMGLPLPSSLEARPVLIGAIQLILSLSIIIINFKFFTSGVRAVIRLAPNMDTLVSLGSGISFGYSLYLFVKMVVTESRGGDAGKYLHDLYFEAAAMILALITLGKLLEAIAKGRTTNAIRSLVALAPQNARIRRDGCEITVSVKELKIGDVFVVRRGESLPADGIVIEGEGAVDESMLTGESIPKDKAVGDEVFGATSLASGFVVCRVTKLGEDSFLSSIIKMVNEASSTKAPIAKLADKVSGIFVPTVLLLSVATLSGWLIAGAGIGYAVGRAISVLVISCPCALGLATPVAIMVGGGVGARHGILYKNASALEVAGRVRTVVFDKTGTLTVGSPSVSEIYPLNGTEEPELLAVAHSLEYMSEHPLGRAIREYCESVGAKREEVSRFEALGGRGVSAFIGEVPIFGASYEYAKTITNIDKNANDAYLKMTAEGKTPIFFIKGGRLLGILALRDKIKDEAPIAIQRLKRYGIKVVMLTGDNKLTASAVSDSLGIDEVYADVLPEGKEEIVRALQAKGGPVAMVGDGINDAPALTRADLGIAIGQGSNIAIDSSGVVLVEEKLTAVSDSISLGRRTLGIIKENLFFAFVYNSIGIPLAAGLFGLALNPMFGAAAMSLSSFSVVMNALRINLWKSASNFTKANKDAEKENKEMTKTIKVEGMMCPHCEARVKSALEALKGVTEAIPSHKTGTVEIVLSDEVSDELIAKTVTEQGYKVV